MHTYMGTQIECMAENYHLVWRNVITTFHLNFILLCDALFVALFSDEINVIYFAPFMCLCYTFRYLAAAELELDISVVGFVNQAAFIKVSYIYVCRLNPPSYGVKCYVLR